MPDGEAVMADTSAWSPSRGVGASGPAASGLRVLEIGESVAAAVAGMVLADNGAEVVIIEPPSGSRLRQSPAWRMWGRGKRATVLDLTTVEGRGALTDLADEADVAVVALEPAVADRLGVDAPTLRSGNDRLVHCEITGFGRGHPLSTVPGFEGLVASRAGRAHEFSSLFEGERPAFPFVPVATHGAAMLALQGIFAALVERDQTGRGQAVETSLLRALGVYELSAWTPGASRQVRIADAPVLFYPVARTADGVWLQFSQNAPHLYRAFLRAIGLEALLDDGRFRTAPHVADLDDARALRALVLARIRERTWDQWRPVFDADTDLSVEPFAGPGDALDHPQMLHTGDSCVVEVPGLGPVRQLGPLATFSATPARSPAHAPPAPVTPAASAARAASADGGSLRWASTPDAGADPATTADAGADRPAPPVADGQSGDTAPALLQGMIVLELATWIATPMATGLLAEMGARVIKIEPLEGDPMRRFGPASFMKTTQGKETIALDLKSPAGLEIVQRLAERADALVHNFRPGVPERLGIDAATLRERNPRLVHHYAASYGSTGPMAYRAAFHVTFGANCGGVLGQLGRAGPPRPDVELDDDELARWSQRFWRANEANPDWVAALAATAALTMALYARGRTGVGQAIETRMMLSNAYALSEHFVDDGRPRRRALPDDGLHGLHALYRLYPTASGWVFVAAADDRAFARLADALGRADLVADARFGDGPSRAANDDALAAELTEVFARREASHWESELAGRGIGCVEVADQLYAGYVFDAPWAETLGFVESSAADGLGPYPRYGRFVRTTADLGPPGSAHHHGAHTRALLVELGYPPERIAELAATGVIAFDGDDPPLAVTVATTDGGGATVR
jgi:crotonobetainyl-CoA:carnitine CoA-transferase CaiB-like acyl-CoA transferase